MTETGTRRQQDLAESARNAWIGMPGIGSTVEQDGFDPLLVLRVGVPWPVDGGGQVDVFGVEPCGDESVRTVDVQPAPREGALVTMHLPGGETVEGRWRARTLGGRPLVGGPFVEILRRASYVDTGLRPYVPGAAVHPAMARRCGCGGLR